MKRVLKNSEAILSVTFYAGEADEPTSPEGDVAVTVTNDRGFVVDTGTATEAEPGVFTYTLAPQPDVERLVVNWDADTTSATTEVEIVGGWIANLGELRAIRDLADPRISTSDLMDARNEAEDLFARYCGVSFTPRYGVQTFGSHWYAHKRAPLQITKDREVNRILAVTVDGAAYDGTATLNQHGYIDLDGWPNGVVKVAYEHGYRFPPQDIRRAFLIYVRFLVLNAFSVADDRAVMATNGDFGTVRLAVAGPNRPTGLPSVDEVLNIHKRGRVVVA